MNAKKTLTGPVLGPWDFKQQVKQKLTIGGGIYEVYLIGLSNAP